MAMFNSYVSLPEGNIPWILYVCCEPKSPGFFTDAQVSSSKLCLGDGFLHPFLMNTKGYTCGKNRLKSGWSMLIYVDCIPWKNPHFGSHVHPHCIRPDILLYFHYIFTMFLFLPWLNRWIHGFIFSARWFVFFFVRPSKAGHTHLLLIDSHYW